MPRIPIKDVLNLLYELQHQSEAKQKQIANQGLDPKLSLLRSWQSQRLRRTYADLLENEKYRSACEFFLSDIYAPRDFSQRDYDAEKLHALLSRYFHPSTLSLLSDAIRMNELSNQLDHALLHVLVDELEVTDTITPQIYAEGYRRCNNYDQRKYQIDLLTQSLLEVGQIAQNPLVGVASRLARGPAERAGWLEIYDFLERGYTALRKMRRTDKFVKIIEQRETTILDRIYQQHPDPFGI